jgi:N-acetylmuramate 1-kinase
VRAVLLPGRNTYRVATKPHDASLVPSADVRLDELRRWLAAVFGTANFSIVPASADASFRRYFRVTHQGQTWIAMDALPQRENLEPYLRVAEMLLDMGVNAPRIVQHDRSRGFLLNTDLGSRTYLHELQRATDATVDALYHAALGALVRIQLQGAAHAKQLPQYEPRVLQRELALFAEWFCHRYLQIELTGLERASFQEICDELTQAALRQPTVFVHRDFHSRNLMVCGSEAGPSSPGILDFQDALQGPLTYDLVSLLRDCYITWPPQRVYGWMELFRSELQQAGVAVGAEPAQFCRWFDLMGVQRHLKAIGIFARLWCRDGKPGYLADIPRTLHYVRSVAEQYGELRFLVNLIDGRVLAALQSAAPP